MKKIPIKIKPFAIFGSPYRVAPLYSVKNKSDTTLKTGFILIYFSIDSYSTFYSTGGQAAGHSNPEAFKKKQTATTFQVSGLKANGYELKQNGMALDVGGSQTSTALRSSAILNIFPAVG